MSFTHRDKVICDNGKTYDIGYYLFVWNEPEKLSMVEMHSGIYKDRPGSGRCQVHPDDQIFLYTNQLAEELMAKYRIKKAMAPVFNE